MGSLLDYILLKKLGMITMEPAVVVRMTPIMIIAVDTYSVNRKLFTNKVSCNCETTESKKI